ncbi:MAG UNVERIFIED_CONTAM: hypothetical protein LVT10_23220 [Anaerolineae bacterium]
MPSLTKLVKQIQIQPSPAGKTLRLTAPALPLPPTPGIAPNAVRRIDRTQDHCAHLPSHKVGVQGMGGVGKSVLSSALAQDYFVRAHLQGWGVLVDSRDRTAPV